MAVSVLQTVLTFVVAPLGLFLLIAAATLLGRRRRRRYQPGQPWPYPPVLWTADPQGADLRPLDDAPADPRIAALTDGGSKATGGARGSW